MYFSDLFQLTYKSMKVSFGDILLQFIPWYANEIDMPLPSGKTI